MIHLEKNKITRNLYIMKRVSLALWECDTWKRFEWIFITILKMLSVCSLLAYCISLNKKYSLGENRSDLRVRGSAKMGFEPKCSNLEAKLPFLECQTWNEADYHNLHCLFDSDGDGGKGQLTAWIFILIPGPPPSADRHFSFLPVAQRLQIPVSDCVLLVNL